MKIPACPAQSGDSFFLKRPANTDNHCPGSVVSPPTGRSTPTVVAILRQHGSDATTKIPTGGDAFRRDKFLEVRAKLGLAREGDN